MMLPKSSKKEPDQDADVEKVLAVTIWMEEFLVETGKKTGYASEESYRKDRMRPRKDGAGKSTSGLFDRYARGDSSPKGWQLQWLFELAPKSSRRLSSVLLRVMRKPVTDSSDAYDKYIEISPHLSCKLFVEGYPDEDGFIRDREITRRLLTDLIVQGSEHSLATLLIFIAQENYADEQYEYEDLDYDKESYLRRRQQLVLAACHCLVFLLTTGQFRPVRTALVARIRQRYLDLPGPPEKKLLLDRYDFIAIADAVSLLKTKALASGKLVKTAVSHRKFFRDVLAGEYGSDITQLMHVPFATPDGKSHDPLLRERFSPRPIELEVFRERKGVVRQLHFGSIARSILKAGLAGYWVDQYPVTTEGT